jgi:hypothetical protein
MSNDRVIGISYNPEDPAPTVVLKGSDAPIGREPGRPMGQLFPVMAVLLAQVLDLDQLTVTEGSSR